ncbi:MAG TPA: peptide MFS transporter [Sphingomonas sp.]|nr:peptide MFS transporter [Sphingomonas sp.]
MAIEELEALPATEHRIPPQGEFLGHPIGLYYIAFTEAWERFSYYGMQALLVLYMVKQLLLPGHVDNIAAFVPFRSALESVYGPLDIQPLSSAIFGLYTSLVYLTPIAGGLVADRLLGKTRTIVVGALLMAAGHFLMAFDVSFLFALLCLVLGVGCFKGNLASQVGDLYPQADLRRADAFQIYYIGINAGVIIAPLVCGTLGEKVGWHWGFGAAGVGMLIGLTIYLAGRKYLPSGAVTPKAERAVAPKPKLSPREVKAIILLLLLIPVLAVGSIGNQELFNAYLIWADRSYDLVFFGTKLPTTWLVTLDSVVSVSFLVGAVAFWRWWATRFREPDEITKCAIGFLLSSSAFVVLAIAAAHAAATGTKVGLGVALVVHVLNAMGFANVFPVSLALYARAAPPRFSATMLGVYYLFLFGANTLVGWVGGWLETMPPLHFWGLHAAMVAGAGVVFLIVKLLFGRILVPDNEEAPGIAPGHEAEVTHPV